MHSIMPLFPLEIPWKSPSEFSLHSSSPSLAEVAAGRSPAEAPASVLSDSTHFTQNAIGYRDALLTMQNSLNLLAGEAGDGERDLGPAARGLHGFVVCKRFELLDLFLDLRYVHSRATPRGVYAGPAERA